MKKVRALLKPAFLALLSAAMLFGATGCSGAGTQKDGVLPENYVPSVSGRLTVSCRSDVYPSEQSQAGIKSWVSDFVSRNSEVDVSVQFNVPPDLSPLIASKSIGDVFFLDDGSLYQYAITQEALMPLDHYVEAFGINLDAVYSGIMELGVTDGRLYFAGMSCGQQSFLYSLDAFYEAGLLQEGERISNDWTWEDFKRYAAALTNRNDDGTYSQIAMSMPVYWSPYFSPFFGAYGGQWYDTTNKEIRLVSDDRVVKGISELINALDQYWIYPNGVSMGRERAAALRNISDPQNIVFSFNTAYTYVPQKGQQYDAQNINWDFAPFPLFDYPASPCGTLGFGVFSYTKNPDAAAALVLSLYTEEGQRALHGQSGGDIPVIKSLGADDFWHLKVPGWEDKNYDAFTANYERYIPSHVKARVPPEIAAILEDGMTDLFNQYLTSGASWQDKLTEMEEACNQLWKTLI